MKDRDDTNYYIDPAGISVIKAIDIKGGADLAEKFFVDDSNGAVEPGMVVVIDEKNPGRLRVSTEAYDKKVAGVISGAKGIVPGVILRQEDSVADGDYPVALAGRVWVKASAENGAIEPGDMLTTAFSHGHAMKAIDYDKARGSIIGKAMSSLDSEFGFVLVLIKDL